MTTEPTQTPLFQQRDWMETAERAERYAENAAYWRAKAKSATQRIAELEARVKQLEAIEREATIRIVELQAEIAGMSPHYFPPPKWNGLQVNMSTGEPLPPSPPAVAPSPVPDNPSDIDPDSTKEDGDRAFYEHVAAERARMTHPAVEVERWATEKAHFAKGGRIQHRLIDNKQSGEWRDTKGPSWADNPFVEYRIHPDDDAPPVEKPATVPQSFNEWFNTKVPQEMRDAYLRSRMQMAWDAARAGTVPLAVAEKLAEALSDLKQDAVVLSKDYLSTFTEWGPDATIQGWPKRRWVAALVAYGKAEKALATFQASTKE